MGHKITKVSKTKFNNALKKSVSENKNFLLKLEKEENIELRWLQNNYNTKTFTASELFITPSSSSVTLSDSSIPVIAITGQILSETNTSVNPKVQLLRV